MQTLRVEAKLIATVDSDGILRLEVPVDFAEQEVEVTLIVELFEKRDKGSNFNAKKEKIRQHYARAYEPWGATEELRLMTMHPSVPQ